MIRWCRDHNRNRQRLDTSTATIWDVVWVERRRRRIYLLGFIVLIDLLNSDYEDKGNQMQNSVSRLYWLNSFWLRCWDRLYLRFEEPTKALLRNAGCRRRSRVCPLGPTLSDRLGCEVRGVWWLSRCFANTSFLFTFTREPWPAICFAGNDTRGRCSCF